MSYKRKIFLYLFLLTAAFALCVVLAQQYREQTYRRQALQQQLDDYAELIHASIETRGDSGLFTIQQWLPTELRITVIAIDGNVRYDRAVGSVDTLTNHLNREEIIQANHKPFGTAIRYSNSTHQLYFYYAKKYADLYVRVALPYDLSVRNRLRGDNVFIYIVAALFVLMLLLFHKFAIKRFSKSLAQLKRFAMNVKADRANVEQITFPHDELGDIGHELAEILIQKQKSQQRILLEREKLILHFQYSEVGLGIFDANGVKIYLNTHFLQYVNLIENKPLGTISTIAGHDIFLRIEAFLYNRPHNENLCRYTICGGGRNFSVQAIVFDDDNFEITIADITEQVQQNQLKQQLTSNIAHELRTPVASIRGYLETLLNNNLNDERRQHFIERAHNQALRLSALIDDTILINKMEEGEERFKRESIVLAELVNEVMNDMHECFEQSSITWHAKIDTNIVINGNRTLLYAIFRNLADNTVAHAGHDVVIHIESYIADGFVHCAYYDSGQGVDEKYLPRLFERFYRVDEGRTRGQGGGSGLGLSIVKNAVRFHHGNIVARNHAGAGLELIFTLRLQ